ncbi:MAG: class I SAM-dependent methyltransferase [Desulfamplus sp.]
MTNSLKKQLRIDWEQRAIAKGASLAGVLLQNFPKALNHYLHEWHIDIIHSKLLPHIPYKGSLLDVASGYGRTSLYIKSVRPDIQIFGLDFAFPYCKHYIDNVQAPSICASIYDSPLRTNIFDGIVAITALMYITDTHKEIVLRQLMQHLKKGGYALLLDPGAEFLKLVSVFKQSRTQTSGKGFNKKEYINLGKSRTTKLEEMGGCPIFSFSLPILYGLYSNNDIILRLLQIINVLDRKLTKYHKITLHRWMLVRYID